MKNLELLKKLKSNLNGGLPFMEGREKQDIEMDEIYNISDYGFLTGEDGEFACFIDKNNDKEFFFGGSVLTSKLKELEEMVSTSEMEELLHEGIEVSFSKRVSKKTKRKYTAVEFFPSVQ